MLTLDLQAYFDPNIAKQLAQSPVQNGALAKSYWPVTVDVMQTMTLWSLCPAMGIACFVATTAQRIRFVAPAFATTAIPVLYAAGSGDITLTAVSGCSGSVVVTIDGDSGSKDPWDAQLYPGQSGLTLTSGDNVRTFDFTIEKDGTSLNAFSLSFIFSGSSL